MKEINYYKQNEILENNYYQIPQELFVNQLYKEKLNSDSKILYAFLLDRLSLSQKNHWIDSENKVYLIFTREEVQEKLCLSDKTVTKAFKQLTEVKLIEEKRQGLGKPNLIYVGKIQHENQENEKIDNSETEKMPLCTCKISDFREGKNTILEEENLRRINTNNIKPNIINTDSINPKSDDELVLIKEKCKLNEFTKDEILILEDVIDTLYYKDNLKVGNIIVNHFKILDKLKIIVKDNLVQLLDILQNIPNIQNAKNYLMICLYNNLGNINVNKMIKKADTIKPNEREYPAGSLDFLYANLDIVNGIA
jgi:hypothetical protein